MKTRSIRRKLRTTLVFHVLMVSRNSDFGKRPTDVVIVHILSATDVTLNLAGTDVITPPYFGHQFFYPLPESDGSRHPLAVQPQSDMSNCRQDTRYEQSATCQQDQRTAVSIFFFLYVSV